MSNVKPSIIKDSARIRTLLKERFTELKLTAKHLVVDATERGMVFTNASLSKYLKHGNVASSLSEENIIWLCIRYGIPINLYVGKAVMKNKGVQFIVPPYNEHECLNNLQKLFNGKAK